MTEEAGAAARRLTLHATCIAIADRGVLFLGPSDSGKSDLALRMIDQPGRGFGAIELAARLVADDQVVLTADGDHLIASAPERLGGLFEIRGLGIVRLQPAAPVRLGLAVMLGAAEVIERYPVEKGRAEFLGRTVAAVTIDAKTASAPARVRSALLHLGHA